eukprot:6479688-Amphidinium_carterae.2
MKKLSYDDALASLSIYVSLTTRSVTIVPWGRITYARTGGPIRNTSCRVAVAALLTTFVVPALCY